MKTSEETNEIVKALIKSQEEIAKVGKDRKNPFAESDYATLDNILEEVKPKLNKNGIFLSQEAFTNKTENSVSVGVVTKFIHSSGQFLEYEPLVMQLEKGAKMNMAQSAGSVITYAKRYSLSAALGISTGEDTDGVHPQFKQNNNQPQPQNQPTPEDNARQIEDKISEFKNYLKQNGKNLDELDDHIADKEKVANINQVDRLRVMGYYKAFATKQKMDNEQEAKKKMEQYEQGSMMQGNTTTPINWGNK